MNSFSVFFFKFFFIFGFLSRDQRKQQRRKFPYVRDETCNEYYIRLNARFTVPCHDMKLIRNTGKFDDNLCPACLIVKLSHGDAIKGLRVVPCNLQANSLLSFLFFPVASTLPYPRARTIFHKYRASTKLSEYGSLI